VGSPHPVPAPRMGRDLPPGLGADGIGDREQRSCPGDATSSPPAVWSILERRAGRKGSLSLASSAQFLSWFPAMLLGCISAMGRGEGRRSSGIFWFRV